MTLTVYISGPMSGYRDHNRAAFFAAEERLVGMGFEVCNPARLDDLDGRTDLPHHVYMKRDIAALLDCDAIYLLPGHLWSQGASAERTVARAIGLTELTDPDIETWRSFEGEPEAEDHACEPVQADGEGRAWCQHGVEQEDVSQQPPAGAGGPAPAAEDLSAHPQWGDIDYAVDDTLPENTLRMVTPLGVRDFEVSWHGGEMLLTPKDTKVLDDGQADYQLAALDKPRPGDRFPDVGYVRRFLELLGRPA